MLKKESFFRIQNEQKKIHKNIKCFSYISGIFYVNFGDFFFIVWCCICNHLKHIHFEVFFNFSIFFQHVTLINDDLCYMDIVLLVEHNTTINTFSEKKKMRFFYTIFFCTFSNLSGH